jgi:hypothetical protein
MPGSSTTPGRTCARVNAHVRVAFRRDDGVGTPVHPSIAAQWLAYAFPCRRFDHILADMTARLGASVVRYAFTAEDFHLLLLAGLPAHRLEGWQQARCPPSSFETRASHAPQDEGSETAETEKFTAACAGMSGT